MSEKLAITCSIPSLSLGEVGARTEEGGDPDRG